jgi:hypothetical protein
VLTKPARASGFQMRNAVLGSWTRTGLAAAVIVLVLGSVAVLGATGSLGDLRYLNIPLIHPWPPAGYYQNPFNPTNRGDIVSTSQAAKAKSDLIADGQIELQAYRVGDGSLLDGADTGNSLVKLRAALAQNHAAGVSEDFTNQLTSVRVGKLTDPNDASVTWCVEEVGTSRITLTNAANGQTIRQYTIRFDDKFWMVAVGGRYLITDAEVQTETVST